MADPTKEFQHIKMLNVEREVLTVRKKQHEEEIRSGVSPWRKAILQQEITKIINRQTEINKTTKGMAQTMYELYYEVCQKSLPVHVKQKLETLLSHHIKNGSKLNEIKEMSLYSTADLEIKTDLKNATAEVTKLKSFIAADKKTAQNLFVVLNARLTPDEVVRFSQCLDFLRVIVNRK